MISVADLRGALAPISKIGQKTTEIEIRIPEGGSVSLTVRPVYLGEQNAVQRDVLEYFTALEEGGEKTTQAEFMIRLRTELTSRSIVAVNGEHIPEHIPTGDIWKDPDTGQEVPVTMTRHEVLIDLVESWAVPIINDFWTRYNDFVTECEQEAERAVKYDRDDIESEISYCEERLEILKGRLQDKKEVEISKHKKLAEDLESEQREAAEQAAAAVREAQEAAEAAREVPEVPETAPSEPVSVPEPEPSPQTPAAPAVPVSVQPPRTRISPQEVAAARASQREKAVQQEPVAPEPAPVAPEPAPTPQQPVRAVPPHMAAREAATRQPFRAPAQDPPKSAPKSLPQAVPGSDIPAYRLDEEVPVLTERNKVQDSSAGPSRYERKGPQSRNPNFKPPA